MPDMLVKLYELPDSSALYAKLAEQNIQIIRPMTPNKYKVHDFILKHFHIGWANEIDAAFTKFPVSCFVAYDTVAKATTARIRTFSVPRALTPNIADAKSEERSLCAASKPCATRDMAMPSLVQPVL